MVIPVNEKSDFDLSLRSLDQGRARRSSLKGDCELERQAEADQHDDPLRKAHRVTEGL